MKGFGEGMTDITDVGGVLGEEETRFCLDRPGAARYIPRRGPFRGGLTTDDRYNSRAIERLRSLSVAHQAPTPCPSTAKTAERGGVKGV